MEYRTEAPCAAAASRDGNIAILLPPELIVKLSIYPPANKETTSRFQIAQHRDLQN
jgi:hypothetical protein